jgi:hypothetical protein
MAGWYIKRGEKIVGPVELHKLQELVATDRLLQTDQLAKDVAGPWTDAGRTKLFAKPKPTLKPVAESPPERTSLVPKSESLPKVVDTPQTTTQINRGIIASLSRGALATWGAISRSLATRAQRKHELKLAKIQAKALADSKRPSAPRSSASTPPARTASTARFPPQVVQTTIVKVVNTNRQSVYGCSGCSLILLYSF